ncbi:conserved hypothetical protein [Heliomicrobium modesticaldum Ice1]|uniref:BIG2 domain-containing protein n=1 Tax=Heliobacterium modesticaldum (strain ATCC 51547 / Ice1) TaxID=498761 RepID=B0TDZ5_HELMI|nr:prepilin-type N-terminal cleavage/methylation domain-containing protein [Heliomicrobium modesticaldum]ABZ82858.1 conserved hypothetical protein [Heliomicrobium modesticaldum Ice1]
MKLFPNWRNSSGMTLLEVLISLALFSIVTAGIFSLLNGNNNVFFRETLNAHLRQESRTSVNQILKTIQEAHDEDIEVDPRGLWMRIDSPGKPETLYELTASADDPSYYDLYINKTRLPVKVLSSGNKFFIKDDLTKMVTVNLTYLDDATQTADTGPTLALKASVLPRLSKPISDITKTLWKIITCPEEISLQVGETVGFPFQAFSVYSNGAVEDITSAVTPVISDPTIVTLTSGSITGLTPGTATIYVSYQGFSASTKVNVTGASIEAISIEPQTVHLQVGQTIDFSIEVKAKYADGRITDITSQVEPTVSDQSIIALEQGKITGKKSGIAYVIVSYQGLSAQTTVTVTGDPLKEYILRQEAPLFLFGNKLSVTGSSRVNGTDATALIKDQIDNKNTSVPFGDAVDVNTKIIFIDDHLYFDGGSNKIGLQDNTSKTYIKGNLTTWNGRHELYGDIYVAGNYRLKDAIVYGNIYVNGNLELGWTPTIKGTIYYTGTLTVPNNYDSSIVKKTKKVTGLDDFQIPNFSIPNLQQDSWYFSRGYTSDPTMKNNMKYFGNSISFKNWGDPYCNNVTIASKGNITLQGNLHFSGILFAPNGKVTIEDSCTFQGIIVANQVSVTGNAGVTFQRIIDDESKLPF